MSAQVEKIYSALQRTLRAEMGKTLPPLVKRWRYTQSSDYAEIPLKPGTARFLIRYGLLDAGAEGDARTALHRNLLKDISRSCGDAPGIVAAWLDLFAEGEYGALAAGICADEPLCGKCGLKDGCRFLATGAKEERASGDKLGELLSSARFENVAELQASDLLAFLIYGQKCGAADFARVEAALKDSGGLRRLLECQAAELNALGFSTQAQARLNAAARLCERWAGERIARLKAFTGGKDFYEHFHLRLRDHKKEVFYVALLDQKNGLIGEERVSEGSLTETMVHPREVFSCAVARRAAAVAVIHNHPSGDPTPSGNDKVITKRLNSVAEMLGIRLLDHVIIGDGRYVSFVESGLLV